MNINDQLRSIRACPEGLIWMKKSGDPSLSEAWKACQRGDWMAWYAAKVVTPETKPALLTAIQECAELAPGCGGLQEHADLSLAAVWAIQEVVAASANGKEITRSLCADIMRKHFPELP